MRQVTFTAVIEREGDGFVAICPELDVASQGTSRAQARRNLQEAVELLLECADPAEITQRLSGERSVETFEVSLA